MEITQSEFDELVTYTLRIEMNDGKVILYTIDTSNKEYLINKLASLSDGDEERKTIQFLFFQTSLNRHVIINTDEFIRITFCFDFTHQLDNPKAYYDNFNVLEKDTLLTEETTAEGETRLHVIEEEYLPQAIIYHKGRMPTESYNDNPLLYSSLTEGCLAGFLLELDGEIPFRQFINLVDNDGKRVSLLLSK